MGAADPTSGTVSLHEIIRGYGALLRRGWKPLRTGELSDVYICLETQRKILLVVIASWDAEEVCIFMIRF